MREGFLFLFEWKDVLTDYPAEVRYEVYDAIIEYAQSGKQIDLKPLAKMAFSFIKKDIDKNNDRYEDVCEKRRDAANRRWKNKGADEESAENIKDANGCKSMQKHFLHYDNEYDNNKKNLSKDKLEKKLEKNAQAENYGLKGYTPPTKEEEDRLKAIMKSFNDAMRESGSGIALVRMLTPERITKLRRLQVDYSDQLIANGFRKAAQSPYLNGKTRDRRRPADFDWIADFDNFTRIFEGGV